MGKDFCAPDSLIAILRPAQIQTRWTKLILLGYTDPSHREEKGFNMPAKLERIDLSRGENIFVNFEGSQENSLFIEVDSHGGCFVKGPMNSNSRTFNISISGIKNDALYYWNR
jgi:hypothetical protein